MATKDYAAIAKKKITTPSEMKQKLPRILIYGRNKKGKTRFCTTAGQGKVLIADPEQGTARMKKINPHVWPIEQWSDMDELYKYLKLGNHPYTWVAIDGLTRIHNMALRFILSQSEERSLDAKPSMTKIQHHGQAGELTKGMLWNFHSLPLGVVFTSQERQINPSGSGDEDEEAEESSAWFVPDLPKGPRSSVNSIVDVIGRIYTVKTEIKVKNPKNGSISDKEVIQRRLWLEPHPSYDTGYRSDYVLPTYLKNPTIPRLMQLIEEGKVQ